MPLEGQLQSESPLNVHWQHNLQAVSCEKEEVSKEPEIKPCPFCGGEAEYTNLHDGIHFGGLLYIKCKSCGACSDVYNDTQKLMMLWNMRHGTPEREK